MFGWRRSVMQRLEAISAQLGKVLDSMITLDSVIASLNDNTTAVAKRMDQILAQIQARANAGSAPTTEQLNTLQAISDHLKQLGVDPGNPVPPAFPVGSLDAISSPVAASQPAPVQVAAQAAPVATTDASTAPIATPDASATPTS